MTLNPLPTSLQRAARWSAVLSVAASGIAMAAPQATYLVNTTADTPDANPGDGICADAAGQCSLRAAIQEANAMGMAATIELQPGATYPLDLLGTDDDIAQTGDLDIATTLVIEGNGATVNALSQDRAFDVMYRYIVEFRDLNVTGGSVVGASGGAFRNGGALRLINCNITASTADGMGASGGGVFNDRGFLFLDGTHIDGCTATRAGGAIESNGGAVQIVRSQLVGNSTGPMPGNGGAFHLTGAGRVSARTTVVMGNSAAAEGGGFWNSASGDMYIALSSFTNNAALGVAADNGGGGLFNDGGVLNVHLTEVFGNTALMGSGSGGGILNDSGVLMVERCELEMNSSARAGGAIEQVAGTAEIRGTLMGSNSTMSSPGNGGALHVSGSGDVTVAQCEVIDNDASAEGGGLWNSAVGTMAVVGCEISRNRASGDDADQGGGGLFNDGGEMTVEGCVLDANVADGASGSGGGVLNNLGALTMSNSRLASNTSNRAGGGIEANVGTTTLRRIALIGNSTGSAPGNGGGLHLTGAGLVTMEGSAVITNDASAEGGGLWNSATGTMTVVTTEIRGNTAPIGPDVFNDGGTFTIDGNPVP